MPECSSSAEARRRHSSPVSSFERRPSRCLSSATYSLLRSFSPFSRIAVRRFATTSNCGSCKSSVVTCANDSHPLSPPRDVFYAVQLLEGWTIEAPVCSAISYDRFVDRLSPSTFAFPRSVASFIATCGHFLRQTRSS